MNFNDEDALLKDFRRLTAMVDDYLSEPAGLRDPGLRLGLIDELEALRKRLLTARDRVGGGIRHSTASFSAATAYGRSHRLRG
jgi:hypothetical protein